MSFVKLLLYRKENKERLETIKFLMNFIPSVRLRTIRMNFKSEICSISIRNQKSEI